jgi:outer membrane lipoprotein-sorting protein
MNKLVRTSLIVAGLIFFFNALAVGNAKANIIDEILKRMQDHYNGLSSLKANVKMDKFNSQLGEHDISEGNLTFIPQKGRDAAFRIDWTKPASETLAVVNKQYVMYRPNIQTAYVGSVNGVKGGRGTNILSIINLSKAELKANYDISYVGQENASGTETWHLLLVPKARADYKSADIWVDGNGMPIQLRQTENNSDTTTIFLSGLNKNSKVNAKDIQISPPKGTKIVKS